MKRVIAIFLLASCAPSPPVFRPVAVDIPVAAPCQTAPVTKPDFALMHSAAADDLFHKTRAALVELDQRKAYEAALESQNSICQ